jgi:hypothetical protein
MPATSGILITSGDTGTVNKHNYTGSIADSKLLQITTAGKVATSALTGEDVRQVLWDKHCPTYSAHKMLLNAHPSRSSTTNSSAAC